MPDISMCDNQACELRKKCYRAMAVPCNYQSWSIFRTKDGKCDDYIEYIRHTKEAEKAADW